MVLWSRAQEDVEDHSKDHEQHVSAYAEPEAWVFHELLIVGAEEDVADGHPGRDPSKMSHKRHLGGETMKWAFSEPVMTQIE